MVHRPLDFGLPRRTLHVDTHEPMDEKAAVDAIAAYLAHEADVPRFAKCVSKLMITVNGALRERAVAKQPKLSFLELAHDPNGLGISGDPLVGRQQDDVAELHYLAAIRLNP